MSNANRDFFIVYVSPFFPASRPIFYIFFLATKKKKKKKRGEARTA